VYNVEPAAAGVREGDWKLVWHAQLPSSVELFNITEDPFEKRDVAAQRSRRSPSRGSGPTGSPTRCLRRCS
jgi:hypothetical protein